VPHHGRIRPHHVDVRFLEHNFLPRALPARLLAGLLRPADHDALSESIEPVDQDGAEAIAVSNQQRDRSDAPHDPSMVSALRVRLRFTQTQAS